MMRKRAVPAKPAQRGAGGRPRKYSEGILLDAALRVMEREGYAALSVRSLAKELGTTHATLYNYIGAIEEIESKALQALSARLPLPRASTPSALRVDLMSYLMAAQHLLLQHPGVLLSPPGSVSYRTFNEVSDRWADALRSYAPDLRTAQLALSVLTSAVVVAMSRDLLFGADYKTKNRMAMRKQDIAALEQYLDGLIDFVLPGLARSHKRPRTRQKKEQG